MGPRTGMDAVAMRKIPCPCRESNPCLARSLDTILTKLSRIPFTEVKTSHFSKTRHRINLMVPYVTYNTDLWIFNFYLKLSECSILVNLTK
jgi:hypothetical protein